MSDQHDDGPKAMGSTSGPKGPGPGTRPAPVGNEIDGWWRLGWLMVAPLTRLVFRLRILGAERIPATGAGIVAANHVSMLDGPVVCLAPYGRGRIVRFLSAAEFFRPRIVGWCLRKTRQIPIRRRQRDEHALDEAIRTVHAGVLAGIFPEGHVNRDPEGDLQRIRTGIARIALAAGAPVLPVGIWGTQARWPRGRLRLSRPVRPPLTLAVGEPIPPWGDPVDKDALEAFTARVRTGLESAVATARSDAESRSPRRPP
ncbi:MAG: lysophospholipid acyltransferase family protein [Actinomycetota bacterium]